MLDVDLGPGAMEWLGVSYKVLLPAAQSGGAMAVVDSVSPPGSGPPRHVHQAEDEALMILTGEIELWLEGESSTAGAGECVFIPRGREHTFRVIGDNPCRHLIILTPGGFEGFFGEMAQGQFRIPDDMDEVNASAARHNLAFTGPPLGAE